MEQSKAIERLLWSIAFPGFAQFLNGHIFKGTVFIILEFLINVNSKLNSAIVASFHGEMLSAVHTVNNQWLLFYPCVYTFAMWDGYKNAGGGGQPFSFLPFVFAAYLGTIGVIYAPIFTIGGMLIGPIFLPILFLILGAVVGIILQRIILKKR